MSETKPSPDPNPPAIFRPGYFLAGLVLGLAFCSIVARVVSHRGYHDTFTRFHVRISPEANYYPTIEEMCGIVRSRCRPDQVLVIVGGNSIFHGVGQPADKMWTLELQRRLGDRFVVINLAFRGALCTDGGALVAEALRREYPRQIYVANSSPFVPPYPYGIEPYRYLFWQARSFGLLEDYAPRNELVEDFERLNFGLADRFELAGAGWLDRVLRYRDLWNWIGYNYYFTIKNPHTPDLPQATWARRKFHDEEGDFNATPFVKRFLPENRDIEMKIVQGFSGTYYVEDKLGRWRLEPKLKEKFLHIARGAVPDDLKARTLIMLSRNSPYYLKNLSSDEMHREDLAYQDGVAAWQTAGYAAAEYGRDFTDDDYGDRTHLTIQGGRKLAGVVEKEIRAMVARLGYLKGNKP
jgi:hypothetical protein